MESRSAEGRHGEWDGRLWLAEGQGRGEAGRVPVCGRGREQAMKKQVYDSAGGTQISPQISLAGLGAEAQCLGLYKEVHSSSCGNTSGCLPDVHSPTTFNKTPMLLSSNAPSPR